MLLLPPPSACRGTMWLDSFVITSTTVECVCDVYKSGCEHSTACMWWPEDISQESGLFPPYFSGRVGLSCSHHLVYSRPIILLSFILAARSLGLQTHTTHLAFLRGFQGVTKSSGLAQSSGQHEHTNIKDCLQNQIPQKHSREKTVLGLVGWEGECVHGQPG